MDPSRSQMRARFITNFGVWFSTWPVMDRWDSLLDVLVRKTGMVSMGFWTNSCKKSSSGDFVKKINLINVWKFLR